MSASPQSDVTVVLITTGESTTDEAREALARQTLQARDTIVVRDVRPFHRALNLGAAQVRTPYFLQLDADMIIDPEAIQRLREAMRPSVGIVVGRLRDALLGEVVGLKLFRRGCFSSFAMTDSISPDTDFVDAIARAGWKTIYIGQPHGARSDAPWHTLGEHRPDYTGAYTYRKFLMEGQRYHHRAAPHGLIWKANRLDASHHPVATLASVALARGVFRAYAGDALGLLQGDDEYARLGALLCDAVPIAEADHWDSAAIRRHGSRFERFEAAYRLGSQTRALGDPSALPAMLRSLSHAKGGIEALLLRLALCQGLLGDPEDDIGAVFERASTLLAPAGLAAEAHEAENSGPALPGFDEIAGYAATMRLKRFAVPPPFGYEYSRPDDAAEYVPGRIVGARADSAGRPRLAAPFRPGGHIVCTDPERLDGAAWCLDLLRAGYLVAHVPTMHGGMPVSLPGALVRCLARRFLPRLTARASTASGALSRIISADTQPYAARPGVILMVTEGLHRGGSERQLVAIAEGLMRKGFTLRLLCLTRLPPDEPSYEADFLKLGVVPMYIDQFLKRRALRLERPIAGLDPADIAAMPRWLGGRLEGIAAAIRAERPQIVHTRQDVPGVSAAIAAVRAGVPHILLQQGSMAFHRRGHPASDELRRAYRLLARQPSVTIVNNSRAGARDNEAWIGLPAGRIGVVYNGLLPGTVRPVDASEADRFRSSLGIPPGHLVVGTIMRFAAVKDPDLWIDAARMIASRRHDTSFIIAGHGPLQRDIEARIAQVGLVDRVHLIGAISDVGLAYAAMDVVMLSSSLEGLPNVMIEAQSIGRPVVAPDVGGTSEALLEGETGIIARPRTAEALAEATLRFLESGQLRTQALQKGPRFVAERFGFDVMVDETVRCYGLSEAEQVRAQ